MPLAMVASAVLLTLASVAQASAPTAPDLRNLRWVRAEVVASSPETITLKLRDRELVVMRDAATEIVASDPSAALAVGAIVEVHYADRKGVRRAIAILADAGPDEISKRAKASLRGTVFRLKRGTLSVRSGEKTRSLSVDRSSRLLDRTGRAIASGRDEIFKILAVDTDLLVKYESDSFVLNGVDLGGDDKAVEIRLLR
jgi:hypothetical protein